MLLRCLQRIKAVLLDGIVAGIGLSMNGSCRLAMGPIVLSCDFVIQYVIIFLLLEWFLSGQVKEEYELSYC
jgi:hypothetical protein